ncbi:HNH endonuclease [Paenacidovorax caeni]|uniref:HNH endonuclease n=1 Tax=Paenacidovorax caeni TaxID=343013 RepID=UPI00398C40D7
MDPFNGLLLTANFDALFDAGMRSFDGDWRILISTSTNPVEYLLLGISSERCLRKINTTHAP